MVGLKSADQAGGVADCAQGESAETPRKIVTATDLNEEQLEGIFSEEDPHKQFEIFTGCLGLPKPESMNVLSRIAAEYDYLNVMFCREQNFSAEQTIAFRGITRSVFEAGIVRGELDVNEAFQEFTERVLSLAGEPDTTSTTTTTTPDHSASNESSVTALTSGGCLSTDGGGGGKGEGGGGGSSAAETRRASGKNPPKVVADSKAKETAVGPKLAGKGSALASVSHGGESGRGGETNSVGSECSGSGSGGGDGSGSGSSGGGGSAGAGPVFSVGDVAAITLFVARGLYRNFGLYRMCFERPAKHRTDIREVQVETPLEPPPLHEAEPIALA